MKKAVIIISILVLLSLLGLWAFLSLGRAGGEIGFEATVTNVEGDIVYATVTRDRITCFLCLNYSRNESGSRPSWL